MSKENVQTLQLVAVELIRPSPLNPRKRFDEAALQELAESIKAKGVLQPVLLRPATQVVNRGPTKGRHDVFELVAGERRVRAARLAGLTEVPAIVKPMTDCEVLEAQVVENEQRADVTPLEKAAGYASLILQHGVPIDDLAARVGKSVSTIRGVMRLLTLPEAAAEALSHGRIPASTAGLIARAPTPILRARLTECVLGGLDEYEARPLLAGDEDEDLTGSPRDLVPEGGPLSFRRTKALIERHLQVELKGAKFDRKAINLIREAGSCEDCPKRVGNLQKTEPDTYAGVRADICTDPECFRAKTAAHQQQLRARAEASGKKVLAGKEAKGLFAIWGDHQLHSRAAYVELEGRCYEDPKRRTYRKLVGKPLADQVVLAEDQDGNLHALLPKDEVRTALRELHNIGAAGGNGHSPEDNWRRDNAKRVAKAKIGKAAARLAQAAVVEKALVGFGAQRSPADVGLKLLRSLVMSFAGHNWADACRLVVQRRGLACEGDRSHSGGPVGAVQREARQLDSIPGLMALFAELVTARNAMAWGSGWHGGDNADVKSFWKEWSIDPAKLKTQAAKAKKAKPRGKRTQAAVSANGAGAGDDDGDEEDEEGQPGEGVAEDGALEILTGRLLQFAELAAGGDRVSAEKMDTWLAAAPEEDLPAAAQDRFHSTLLRVHELLEQAKKKGDQWALHAMREIRDLRLDLRSVAAR